MQARANSSRSHCLSILANQINRADNTMLTDSRQNYIPCLVQSHTKLVTLFSTEKSKTTPRPATHPGIDHIRK